jgi:flagellar biosynthesis component FlhA
MVEIDLVHSPELAGDVLETAPEPVSAEAPSRGAIAHHVLDTIARMMVSGAPYSLIAAATGLTVERVRNAAAVNQGLKERVEVVRAEVFRNLTAHHYELMGMLPEVRAAISSGLRSQDEPTKLATAKWLHEAVVPKPIQRTETDHFHTGNVQQQHDVSGVLVEVGKSLAALAQAQVGKASYLERVKSGPDALPRVAAPVAPEGNGSQPPDEQV